MKNQVLSIAISSALVLGAGISTVHAAIIVPWVSSTTMHSSLYLPTGGTFCALAGSAPGKKCGGKIIPQSGSGSTRGISIRGYVPGLIPGGEISVTAWASSAWPGTASGEIIGYQINNLGSDLDLGGYGISAGLALGHSSVQSAYSGNQSDRMIIGGHLSGGLLLVGGFVRRAAVVVRSEGKTLRAPVVAGLTGYIGAGLIGPAWLRWHVARVIPSAQGISIGDGSLFSVAYHRGKFIGNVTYISGLGINDPTDSGTQRVGPRVDFPLYPDLIGDPAASYQRGTTIELSYQLTPALAASISATFAPSTILHQAGGNQSASITSRTYAAAIRYRF